MRNCNVRTRRHLPNASRAAGRSEQSSKRRETNPLSFAGLRAAPIYSTDFLSKKFCDRSKNCSFRHFFAKIPMSLKAGVLSRRFDATDRKLSVPGMVSACSRGLRT